MMEIVYMCACCDIVVCGCASCMCEWCVCGVWVHEHASACVR